MQTRILMGQILALCSMALGGLFIRRITGLELTLACLFSGVLGSIVVTQLHLDTGLRANNIQDLVFYVLLPVLVFDASWHLNIQSVKKWLPQCLNLAIFGVLISAALIAVGVFYGVNHPGFPWLAAGLTGIILAATDPVAVTAQLKAFGAPEGLTTLFEGESFFNDASVIVFFAVLLDIATNTATPGWGIITQFATVFLGGAACGWVVGMVALALLRYLRSPVEACITLLFFAFLSFYLAEHMLHVSGIMSVVLAAWTIKSRLQQRNPDLIETVADTWSWIGTLFTALMFALMGLLITVDMFIYRWQSMVIAIAAVVAARFISVFSCNTLTNMFLHRVPVAWSLLLSWGGLRGAIALALVLSLPHTLTYWWTIQSMVFGVILFTLLVQGTTTPALMRRLKLVS